MEIDAQLLEFHALLDLGQFGSAGASSAVASGTKVVLLIHGIQEICPVTYDRQSKRQAT